MLIPLHFLAYGQTGRVHQVVGLPADVHRLEELGFRRGVAVEMLQPGSPCIVRLAESRMCFRDNEQLKIVVELGEVA